MMSNSTETYPGQDLSISHLLYAVRKKLQATAFAGRFVWLAEVDAATNLLTAGISQVDCNDNREGGGKAKGEIANVCRVLTTVISQADLLEHEVLEVLSLVRCTKNTFLSVNKIPPEVFSLVAHHCDTDEDLITLTHVCRRWRVILVSCPSLWTNLGCKAIDKTRVYLERSKASPLKISLEDFQPLGDAFLLLLPHLGRLGSLSLFGTRSNFLELTKHLGSPAPLLKNLKLVVIADEPVLQDTVFDGDLSSLHRLHLDGVVSNMAWKDVSNLRTLVLRDIRGENVSVNKLLHLFERAPLLRKIDLWNAFPDSSDAPPGRVESLPNLEFLRVDTRARKSHAVLLNHLSVPIGAQITQNFVFDDADSPIPFHLPRAFENLKNLSNIASINLDFVSGVRLRLRGPNGGLYMSGRWADHGPAPIPTRCRVLRSLNVINISTVERFTISRWSHTIPWQGTTEASIYQTFLLMGNIRALALIGCINFSFFVALNPKANTSGVLICPTLEELTVYSRRRDWFHGRGLLGMAGGRASVGAKLKTVVIMGPQELISAREIFKLRAHVSHVEHKFGYQPRWDLIPGVPDDTDYETDD